MAKWEIKENVTQGLSRSHVLIYLLRDNIHAGLIIGWTRNPLSGRPLFEFADFWANKEHQQEYMASHNGTKIGEALWWRLLRLLKKDGVQYIRPLLQGEHAEKFIERFAAGGVIERTSEGLLKINYEKIPLEKAMRQIKKTAARKNIEKTLRENATRTPKRRPR